MLTLLLFGKRSFHAKKTKIIIKKIFFNEVIDQFYSGSLSIKNFLIPISTVTIFLIFIN